MFQIQNSEMTRLYFKLLFIILYFIRSHAMMIRNDALISKMVSDFQKDNTMTLQQQQQQQQQLLQQQQPKNVLAMMQNVLCKNFPTVPCNMIVQDETLKNLIQRSIQQLKYKKLSLDKTTPIPSGYHLTLFPSINTDDLSNFLQVSDSGYYRNKQEKLNNRHKKRTVNINLELNKERDPKKRSKLKKESTRTLYSGRKKIRKFYPHNKYKEKLKGRKDFGDYSEEKLSMSVEVPDVNMGGILELNRKSDRINYKADAEDGEDPPVWRIDYLKHGDAGLNVFGNEPDTLKEKLVKTDPNVIVSEDIVEQAPRKGVMHPDVYIKKNYIRKNALLEMDSSALD